MNATVGVIETELSGLPALQIGNGTRKLLYLPGLTFDSGLPKGAQRKRAASGWDPLLDRYTIFSAARKTNAGVASFSAMAADSIAALEHLADGSGPADLMGFSTGGVIAFRAAAARPDLVRRLVLVATGTQTTAFGVRTARRAVAAIGGGDWRGAYSAIMSVTAGSALGDLGLRLAGWLAGPRLIGIPADPSQLISELEAWEREDASALSVALPTLLIANQRDRVFPLSSSMDLMKRLTEGTLVVVPGKGHSFPIHAVAEHVSPFLGAIT